jgi:hypothetical protein
MGGQMRHLWRINDDDDDDDDGLNLFDFEKKWDF